MLISNNKSNQSFTGVMQYLINTYTLNEADSDWVHYLQDHREYIQERSNKVTIDPSEMVYYRYRIRKYLQHRGNSVDCELAFRLINYIKSDLDFNESITEVYIPPVSVIRELQRSYATLQTQIRKL